MAKKIMPASEYRRMRKTLKLSHSAMAETFGFDPRTSRRYESGEHEPGHTLRKLLRLVFIVGTKPKAVAKLTIAAAVALVIGSTSPTQAGYLPDCKDEQVVQMAKDAIANSPAGRAGVLLLEIDAVLNGERYVSAEQLTPGPHVVTVDPEMRRLCLANATTSLGPRRIEYTYQRATGGLFMRAKLLPPY